MKMQKLFTIKSMNVGNGNTVNSELEDGNDSYDISCDDPTMPLLWTGKAKQTGADQKLDMKYCSCSHIDNRTFSGKMIQFSNFVLLLSDRFNKIKHLGPYLGPYSSVLAYVFSC